ncbi:hypothetical protein [Sphingomonas baiyangensis]|uniref:YD repeat-containing protein n=1 Tax=Sphingomonas baiyangensis TaxID=2572576 RepID=A0A4U1L112_9SPHN|nr:hypothetical protein [Sphingomonas baiyangensis]TKD50214.1 hypothetical protein FBR43_05185 [Sphingomonas baiyangensis]
MPDYELYRDSAGVVRERQRAATGGDGTASLVERDTDGNPVPTHKAHAYTYDSSGNLHTDTVTDGADRWVRTLEWGNGVQTGDSGWVKQ